LVNIDLASLDQNEADKWLFDVVQPWMEKNEKYFGVRGFIPLTVRL
jgi:pyrimidine-specific ribonucleoside hydrolase